MRTRNITVMLCGLFSLFYLGSVQAVPQTLTDTTYFTHDGTNESADYVDHGWGKVNKLDSMFDFVAWEHQFTFDPPASEILSGTLAISLYDDSRKDLFEFAMGWAEDGTWDFGEVDTGTYDYDVGVNALEDGVFGVKIKSKGGDFYIKKSQLTVDYNAEVPEPATLFLLGSGLLGAGIAARRRRDQA